MHLARARGNLFKANAVNEEEDREESGSTTGKNERGGERKKGTRKTERKRDLYRVAGLATKPEPPKPQTNGEMGLKQPQSRALSSSR